MEMAPDFRARICKSLWSPEIYSKESIPPDWESIPGRLKRLQIRALFWVFQVRVLPGHEPNEPNVNA
jgi:hypothetical protein